MQCRLTLHQNLPNRAPSAFQVRYGFRDGSQTTWPVTVVDGYPDRDTGVLVVDGSHELIHAHHVLARTLLAHYPTSPDQVEISISSAQPPNAGRADPVTPPGRSAPGAPPPG